MAVHKYRSVADMPTATWRPALDPDNLRLAFQVSAVAACLARTRVTAGVYRYRSVEEAAAARERWERRARPAQTTSLPPSDSRPVQSSQPARRKA